VIIQTYNERKEKEFENDIHGYEQRTLQPDSINHRQQLVLLVDYP
jgi:hypothetical protein